MATGQPGAGAAPPSDETAATAPFDDQASDAEWLALTDGMEPYERFRFIARHVLQAAVEEAGAYAADQRIFDKAAGDVEVRREHLSALDEALRGDGSLGPLEREFLCAAVALVMDDHDMVAACPWEIIRSSPPARRAARSTDRSR